MKRDEYQALVASLEGLTPEQLELLSGRVSAMNNEQSSLRLTEERIDGAVICPQCQADDIFRHGKTNGQQRYRCKTCLKTFTALTGTGFCRLNDKDKLLAYAECMVEGLSIRKAGERVGLAVDRSFRWRHRFLDALREHKAENLTGIVEADETIFRRSYKGQRRLPRQARKRGGSSGVDGKERVPVMIVMQRGSRMVSDAVLDDCSAKTFTKVLKPALAKDAVLSTDGHPSYGVAAKSLKLEAGYFVAGYHGHGGRGTWHVQNVNAYDSRLKRWMGRFNGVATRWLPNYLGWRRMLDKHLDEMTGQLFLYQALRAAPQHVIQT